MIAAMTVWAALTIRKTDGLTLVEVERVFEKKRWIRRNAKGRNANSSDENDWSAEAEFIFPCEIRLSGICLIEIWITCKTGFSSNILLLADWKMTPRLKLEVKMVKRLHDFRHSGFLCCGDYSIYSRIVLLSIWTLSSERLRHSCNRAYNFFGESVRFILLCLVRFGM